ncbi:MAG: N-acetylmuramoyl-L-alanine amidase [Chloroflexi bacterium]|nr:N-acetylmuramoyl-L-alanine amidase [Chloroflexota bacterium]
MRVVVHEASAFSPSVSLLMRVSHVAAAIALLGLGGQVLVPPAGAAASVNGKTIVVDPGHGGKDPGAVDNGIQEKSITLAVGQQLASILQAEGAQVVMTRTTDVNPAPSGTVDDDLQARVGLAQQSHANLFISIHANEAADPTVTGATTFYGPVCGFYSGVTLSPTDVGRSYSLAQKVQAAIVARTQEHDNGTPAAAFWVLGNPGIPAILVETAFLSNKNDAAKLVDPGYQHLLADSIADGLNAFFASGDATGTPPAPKDGLAGCSGTAAKDDRSQSPAPPQPVERWVQTIVAAPLLSGPDPNAKVFTTLPAFSYLKILGQSGDFLNVLNPATNGPGFVEAKKVGPSGPPPPPPTFQPFWVQSFRPTQLWSGTDGNAVNFGPLPTWSYLQVLAPTSTSRFQVRIAASGNVAYVDQADVGPSGAPPAASAAPAQPAAASPPTPAPTTPTANSGPTTVTVAAGDTLSAIAGRAGVSVASLIAANHLDSDGTILAGQQLSIPGAGAAPATAPSATPAPQPTSTVVVAAGDTLTSIAARAGVSVAALAAANHLTPDGIIAIGQKLTVPAGGASTPAPSPKQSPATTATVNPGDTLSAIAAHAGVSVQALVDLNHLKSPDDIQAGQTLKIPASS